MVEDGTMVVRVFCDDDDGYLTWLDNHPGGCVVNIARSYNAAGARLHHASCRTISGEIPRGRAWTGPYVKVCAEYPAELERWAANKPVGNPIKPCGTCQPARHRMAPESTQPKAPALARPLAEGHCTVNGPVAGRAVVEAWADDYIRFQDRPRWQEELRNEIRSGCEKLAPAAGQLLHASFFGSKRPEADVENLVLYNIGSFKVAGRNGIRFEHGVAAPPAPDGARYPFCYRYALAARREGFTHWRQGRILASFDWTDLGALAGEKKSAQVWLALKRSPAMVAESGWTPETPFGVRIHIRPPFGHQPVWGNLVKGIFDGVICALHAHTDTQELPEVAKRLASTLPADAADIEALLREQHTAVLGAVPRLVTPHGTGVAWHPADHLCVAGELLPAEPAGQSYAIEGELFEVSR
jgi:hypothetical protein